MANLQGADSLSALEQYKRRGNEAHAKEGYKEAQKLYTKALTLTVDPEVWRNGQFFLVKSITAGGIEVALHSSHRAG